MKRMIVGVAWTVGAMTLSQLAPAQTPASFPGQVSLFVECPSEVGQGASVTWTLRAVVTGENLGLAAVSADLTPSGPTAVVLTPGTTPSLMLGFARPGGFSNPAPAGSSASSGFGGTPVDLPGGSRKLIEVGGMQNVFGVATISQGVDVAADESVGSAPNGVIVTSGEFTAPTTQGSYEIGITNPAALLLTARMGSNPSRFVVMAPSEIVVQGGAFAVVEAQCDDLDFNNDGVFPDTQDIFDFLVVHSGGECPSQYGCNDIDFNNDDVYPDTCDLFDFLDAFAGSPCPACGL